MSALLTQLLQYGTTPALVVLSFVVGLLVKKIDENGKADERRAKEMEEVFSRKIEQMEAKLEARLSLFDRKLEELTLRISCVERDYLQREDYYEAMSGWRTEIHRLYDAIMAPRRKEQ